MTFQHGLLKKLVLGFFFRVIFFYNGITGFVYQFIHLMKAGLGAVPRIRHRVVFAGVQLV
jgi:hypothetical protein